MAEAHHSGHFDVGIDWRIRAVGMAARSSNTANVSAFDVPIELPVVLCPL